MTNTDLIFGDFRCGLNIENCYFFLIKTSEGNYLLDSIYSREVNLGINQNCLYNYEQFIKLSNFRVKQKGTFTFRKYKTSKGLLKAII